MEAIKCLELTNVCLCPLEIVTSLPSWPIKMVPVMVYGSRSHKINSAGPCAYLLGTLHSPHQEEPTSKFLYVVCFFPCPTGSYQMGNQFYRTICGSFVNVNTVQRKETCIVSTKSVWTHTIGSEANQLKKF